ncbi:S1C family serine protease [Arthrobacter sp. BPSS-3]|uniref:S1C family serine protease n=1 Tax=Arthrobacter sp. BPSS-3 TaxID=3366580 RepID=UPI0037DCBD83
MTAAAKKASPSVVTISATSGSAGGTGSGIILDAQGHILTNTHVVTLDGQSASASIEVRTNDGNVYPGTVVGTDPLSDLAVVKIDSQGLVPAALGDSSKANVGDKVIAIGAPLGLQGTVTDGIVSALNRTISIASSAAPDTSGSSGSNGSGGNGRRYRYSQPGAQNSTGTSSSDISINVLQTDAPINPGNSGGPLVNSAGEVLGINVAIASAGASTSGGQSGSIGVGFSIPVNDAKRVAQEIIAGGSASHGQLGASLADAQAGSGSQFTSGAQVTAVSGGTPAANAGITSGDVITALDGRAIQNAEEATASIREHAAGDTVSVTLMRGGTSQHVDVTLGATPKA